MPSAIHPAVNGWARENEGTTLIVIPSFRFEKKFFRPASGSDAARLPLTNLCHAFSVIGRGWWW